MGNFDIIQFLAALVGLFKILAIVVAVILLIISLADGDEKRKTKEIIWGVGLLALTFMIFPIASKIAGGAGAQTLQQVLGSWDPRYLQQLAS